MAALFYFAAASRSPLASDRYLFASGELSPEATKQKSLARGERLGTR